MYGGAYISMVTPPYGIPVSIAPEKIREQIRSGVVDRLRRVCENWNEDEFERLVEDITRTEMRYLKTPH